MLTLVFNGWAAGPETWEFCTFARDWTFDYLEEMDGLPARVLAETDAAVLVGFSMGGSFALEMALTYPEKIRGLVLVSATARMTEDPATGWKGMSDRRRAALKLGTKIVYRNDPSPLFADANLERGLDFLRDTDLRERLRAIPDDSNLRRIPVTIFQSERDGIVRPPNAAFLKSVFPQASVRMVPGAEHVLPLFVPAEIDAAVARSSDGRILL